MTLRLRPGLHVSRRDDAHLQVGLDPPTRVVLRDGPDVRRLLDRLVAGTCDTGTSAAPSAAGLPLPAQGALARLVEAGLVEHVPTGSTRAGVAPLVVLQPAGECVSDLLERLRRLLHSDGVDVVVRDDHHARPPEDAALVVVVATGEARRAAVDAHVRDGRAHLVLGGGADRVVLGPLVSPGLTACLRCVDAHRSESDPRRGLVLAQVEGRAGGHADTALTALTAAWAARDVLTFLAGACPSTWSATVAIGPDLLPHREEWQRHPWCGCAWDVVLREDDQRGAG